MATLKVHVVYCDSPQRERMAQVLMEEEVHFSYHHEYIYGPFDWTPWLQAHPEFSNLKDEVERWMNIPCYKEVND